MPKKKTHKEYEIELLSVEASVYPVEKYINYHTKILHKCIEDHDVYIRPSDALNGVGCAECAGLKPYTISTFNSALESKNKSIVCLSTKYINSKTHLLFKCEICTHEWNASPASVLSATGCPSCAGNRKKTTEDYIKDLRTKNLFHTPIEPYINTHTPIEHKCGSCSSLFVCRPHDVLSGVVSCKTCSTRFKTDSQYKIELKSRNIASLEPYIAANSPILHKCLDCNIEWRTKPSHIVNDNTGCPSCAKSGFDPEKPAILYFVSLVHEEIEYYKLGITNRTVKKRLSRDWNNFQFNLEWTMSFTKGKYAKEAEKIILDTYSIFKAPNAVPLLGGGSTEVITVDITPEEAFILVGHLLDHEKLSIYVASPIKI
jgi:hypothetical protein